jgi:hypothetical protein
MAVGRGRGREPDTVVADLALEHATADGDDSALGSAWVAQALVSASTTYPGRTTITREQRIRVQTDRVLRVALEYHGAGTPGASGMLKKVISIYGEISAPTELKASFTSTRKESKFVSSRVEMTIPGGVSVACFKGHAPSAGRSATPGASRQRDARAGGGREVGHRPRHQLRLHVLGRPAL